MPHPDHTDGQSTADPPGALAPVPALRMVDVSIGSLQEPDRVVFEDVCWSVATGDFWAIGGLHACGKTDFMATTAGLMRPLRGIYDVFGRELAAGFEPDLLATRRRLGLVFDGGHVLRQLTVAENVALPVCYHRDLSMDDADADVEPLLRFTGLLTRADQAAGFLGRNWQQRVGLARALALKPEVLLLDSPLSGLDPRDAGWWVERLTELSAGHPIVGGRPMTLVVSGDDLRPWQGRARQFAVLRDRQFLPLPADAGARPADDLMSDLLDARTP